MHHFQSLPQKAVAVYSFEHICSADSTLSRHAIPASSFEVKSLSSTFTLTGRP